MSTEKTTARHDIDTERQRQIMKGFDAAHDDQHKHGELVSLALEMLGALSYVEGCHSPDWIDDAVDRALMESTPIQTLAKVAAVIEAEIERLKRLKEEEQS